MAQHILKSLESKGITIPEEHIQPLLTQWEAYQQLKSNPGIANLADYNIGLQHIPGGDKA